MSINFKIFFPDLEKTVLVKGDLVSYKNNYESLRDKLIEKSNCPLFKHSDKWLNKHDKFKLVLQNDINIDLKYIFNTASLNYLVEKLQAMKDEDIKLRFHLIKIAKFPDWSPPKFGKILEDCLQSSFESIKKKILYDLQKFNKNEVKKNIDVVCNNCLKSNFIGLRYICSECNNYNLCENCINYYNNHYNKEHLFIRLNNPVEVNLNHFNNQFMNNNQTFYEVDRNNFDINLDIFNSGKEDLIDCFIIAIKFGEKYLKCDKFIINEHIIQNDTKSVKIHIKDFCGDSGIYKGVFRMFTKEGLPFGDVLNITVINKGNSINRF